MTMQVIQHTELGSAQAKIEFNSIPSTFTDLMLCFSLRDNNSSNNNNVILAINGVTTNASNRTLWGSGSSAASYSDTPIYIIGGAVSNNATSGTFSSGQIYIPNYAGSTNKSFSIDSVSENNATASVQTIIAGLWSQTAAISSLELRPNGSLNFQIGSSATLYGILKGSSGGVTVS